MFWKTICHIPPGNYINKKLIFFQLYCGINDNQQLTHGYSWWVRSAYLFLLNFYEVLKNEAHQKKKERKSKQGRKERTNE